MEDYLNPKTFANSMFGPDDEKKMTDVRYKLPSRTGANIENIVLWLTLLGVALLWSFLG